MAGSIPTSLQSLLSLADITSASKQQRDEDYFYLKRDYDNLINAVTALLVAIQDGEFSPVIGTGSPEGVVTANHSLKYIDESVPTEYYNPTYGANTGWIAL